MAKRRRSSGNVGGGARGSATGGTPKKGISTWFKEARKRINPSLVSYSDRRIPKH